MERQFARIGWSWHTDQLVLCPASWVFKHRPVHVAGQKVAPGLEPGACRKSHRQIIANLGARPAQLPIGLRPKTRVSSKNFGVKNLMLRMPFDLVDDRAHAFLQGIVLRIDAIDAGERFGLLDPISLWPEVGALTSPPAQSDKL